MTSPTPSKRLLQVAGFVTGVVVLDVILGSLLAGLGSHADPKSSPIGLLNALERNPDTEVLVLGSSRANHHMDPEVLSARLGRTVHNAGSTARASSSRGPYRSSPGAEDWSPRRSFYRSTPST